MPFVVRGFDIIQALGNFDFGKPDFLVFKSPITKHLVLAL